jgi:hypothetical protein
MKVVIGFESQRAQRAQRTRSYFGVLGFRFWVCSCQGKGVPQEGNPVPKEAHAVLHAPLATAGFLSIRGSMLGDGEDPFLLRSAEFGREA